MAEDLHGRVALVTGGASGIGHAIAQILARAGAHVLVADVDEHGAQAAAEGIAGSAMRLDVGDEADWAQALRRCREDHGRLDVLVNAAGTPGTGATQDLLGIELEEWHRVLRVNLEGVLLGCRAAIPLLAEDGGGAVVNITSVTGRLASPRAVAYGASKAAVNHLTITAAYDCARRGLPVRVNAVEPGVIDTPMTDRVLAADRERGLAAARRRAPMGTLGEAADVAEAALYLASDASRYVTGTLLTVDGGWSIPH